jgi:hypothetical protein
MIYRIIGESQRWVMSGDDTWKAIPGPLRGGFYAYLCGDDDWDVWDDLPAPAITNPRAHCWFTECGWHDYGRHITAAARRTGRPYRVIRRKNPPRSAVVYRDRWQVALLPGK